MKHGLIVRPEAEHDIEDAYRWYEVQRPGLGSDFLLCKKMCFRGKDLLERRPFPRTPIPKNFRHLAALDGSRGGEAAPQQGAETHFDS
jgi:hypothetical protein